MSSSKHAMAPPVWEAADYESAWSRFETAFDFQPTRKNEGPAMSEPPGSITYDLTPCFNGRGQSEWARHAVNFSIVWALADLATEHAPILVLDWQHPTYKFWPHRNDSIHPSAMLGESHIAPIPEGDFHAFLTEDLSNGTFGHPWQETLCVFGDELLARVDPVLRSILPITRLNEPG